MRLMAVWQLPTLKPTTSACRIRVLKRVPEVQTEPATHPGRRIDRTRPPPGRCKRADGGREAGCGRSCFGSIRVPSYRWGPSHRWHSYSRTWSTQEQSHVSFLSQESGTQRRWLGFSEAHILTDLPAFTLCWINFTPDLFINPSYWQACSLSCCYCCWVTKSCPTLCELQQARFSCPSLSFIVSPESSTIGETLKSH